MNETKKCVLLWSYSRDKKIKICTYIHISPVILLDITRTINRALLYGPREVRDYEHPWAVGQADVFCFWNPNKNLTMTENTNIYVWTLYIANRLFISFLTFPFDIRDKKLLHNIICKTTFLPFNLKNAFNKKFLDESK